MVGPPGAGKGTQAALLAERMGLAHVASGDLFRDHISRATALGKKVKSYLDRGALVPDDLAVQLIAERLGDQDAAEGVVLDGFPRTREQAEALDRMLSRLGGRVEAALYIDVDRDEIIHRLSGRWICSSSSNHVYHEITRPPRVRGLCDIDDAPLKQRDDDRPETVKARLELQLPPMFEVVDYYSERGVLSTVDGEQSIEEVTDALLRGVAQPAR
jgi:adenylate kinase